VTSVLRIGQAFRDMDRREAGRRVVCVTRLDVRYAYVRDETFPHRRSRLLRRRLASSAFEYVGEMGRDQSVWPLWFSEDVDTAQLQTQENERKELA
jgi:hypothetical protein